MDRMREFERDDGVDHAPYVDESQGVETPPAIGNDERRMHVRAYNYWVSLLDGRAYPAIQDLDPSSVDDFGAHSVLLDFTAGIDNPGIAWLGRDLREECDLDASIRTIADVPSRSLLSRLTDHYLQIIANRAPIGFEAEFTSTRGLPTMYRGILMPFSSDEDTIDFIYGVINWKEVAPVDLSAELMLEVDQAIRSANRTQPAASVWADGPNAGPAAASGNDDDYQTPASVAALGAPEEPELVEEPDADAGIHDWLAAARATAETSKACEGRSRGALYDALGRAYDFALAARAEPEDYAELLEDAGLTEQARAPMTPVVKLVFGADYDKTRLTEYAAALSHGLRQGVARGGLTPFLNGFQGGLKGVVKAERALRAPSAPVDRDAAAREALRDMTPKAIIDIESGSDEFVVLVARRLPGGSLAILSPVLGDAALVDRAVRKAAG